MVKIGTRRLIEKMPQRVGERLGENATQRMWVREGRNVVYLNVGYDNVRKGTMNALRA